MMNKIKKGLRNPRELVMEFNAKINWWRQGESYNTEGVNIINEDWDLLIILDALRFDDFKNINTLPGELSFKYSRGGGTVEFLKGNFRNRNLTDTVYITANPQLYHNQDTINSGFHAVHNIWKENWDESLSTVHPKDMAEKTIELSKQYPNKRIISHFVQPHEPFIGPTAEEHDLDGWIDANKTISWSEIPSHAFANVLRTTDSELYRQAYRENIELTLPHVKSIFDGIDGKMVVSSDHGELFGERVRPIPIKYDSHRIGCHTEEMLKVPWLEYHSGERRNIVDETQETDEEEIDIDTEERLSDLGYL